MMNSHAAITVAVTIFVEVMIDCLVFLRKLTPQTANP